MSGSNLPGSVTATYLIGDVSGSTVIAQGSTLSSTMPAIAAAALAAGPAATAAAASAAAAAALISPKMIGGIPVGTAGLAGTIYANYKLAGGDDFGEAAPQIVTELNPYGKYFPTHPYSQAGNAHDNPRGSQALTCYEASPGHFGWDDYGRGAPINYGANGALISQSGSVLTLQCRAVTAGQSEAAAVDHNQQILSGMIHSGGSLLFFFPYIIEYYAAVTPATAAGAPAVSHGSLWEVMSFPYLYNNGQYEDDFEGFTGITFDFSNYAHNPIAQNTQLQTFERNGSAYAPAMFDGMYHLWSRVVYQTGADHYADNAYVGSLVQSNRGLYGVKPSYMLATAHSTTTTTYATPLTIQLDWFRVWQPASGNSWAPLVTQPDIVVAFNTPFSVTLPSAMAVWGSAIGSNTDSMQAIPHSVRAPGGSSNGMWAAQNMPAEIIYNPATNVLSGTVSDQPGRVYLERFYGLGGDVCVPQRILLRVGPRIVGPATRAGAIGTPYEHDVYSDCDVGDDFPKTITVSALPAGLSYIGAGVGKGYITGTPTALGSYTVTVKGGSGLSASQTYTIATPTAGSGLPTPPITTGLIGALDFDNSSLLTLSAGGIVGAGAAFGTSGAATGTAGATAPQSTKVGFRNAAVFVTANSTKLDWSALIAAAGVANFEDALSIVLIGSAAAGATGAMFDIAQEAASATSSRALLALNSEVVATFASSGAFHTASDGVNTTGNPFCAILRKPSVYALNVATVNATKLIFNKDRGPNNTGALNAAGTGNLPAPDHITLGAQASGGTINNFGAANIYAVLIYDRYLEEHEKNQMFAWAAATVGTP